MTFCPIFEIHHFFGKIVDPQEKRDTPKMAKMHDFDNFGKTSKGFSKKAFVQKL